MMSTTTAAAAPLLQPTGSIGKKQKNLGNSRKTSLSDAESPSLPLERPYRLADNSPAPASGPGPGPAFASGSRVNVNGSRSANIVTNIAGQQPTSAGHGKGGWKSSKLFSKTLSSIEVIRAMKGKPVTGNTAAANPTGSASSGSLSAGNEAVTKKEKAEPVPTAVSSTPSTSTHHSILLPQPKSNSKAVNEWKFLKNKLTGSRKKTPKDSVSTDYPTIVIDSKAGDYDSPNTGILIKPRSGSATGPTRARAPSLSKRSESQDEGIICKREDLLHLLTEASKSSLVKTKSNDSSQSTSTSPTSSAATATPSSTALRRTSLKQQTSSQSSEKEESVKSCHSLSSATATGAKHRASFSGQASSQGGEGAEGADKASESGGSGERDGKDGRDAGGGGGGGEGCRDYRANASQPELKENKSSVAVDDKSQECDEVAVRKGKEEEEKEEEDRDEEHRESDRDGDGEGNGKGKGDGGGEGSGDVVEDAEAEDGDGDGDEDEEGDDSGVPSTVKWDESNTVDAMMIGDAIEAFLKGMGSSTSSSTSATSATTEKRVSFKKNC